MGGHMHFNLIYWIFRATRSNQSSPVENRDPFKETSNPHQDTGTNYGKRCDLSHRILYSSFSDTFNHKKGISVKSLDVLSSVFLVFLSHITQSLLKLWEINQN